MASIVRGIETVARSIGQPPTVVGGLAVMSRLSKPHRVTVDLDIVDRGLHDASQLEVLRSVEGADVVEPSAVSLQTEYGAVKVDVLEVRQVELDQPSNDPGDRLHATAHAWAFDTATDVTFIVELGDDKRLIVTTPVAEPGPLIAMKLQAVDDRGTAKQGTDLLDIVRLTSDRRTREAALAQLEAVDDSVAADIALHVDRWLVKKRQHALTRINRVPGAEVVADDLDLVAELLASACSGRRAGGNAAELR